MNDKELRGALKHLSVFRQEPLLYRPEEAAYLMGISRSKMYGLLASKELPAVRVGRSVRVSRKALEEYLTKQS